MCRTLALRAARRVPRPGEPGLPQTATGQRRKRRPSGEAACVEALELRLSNGQTLPIRVENVEAEIADLSRGTGRFAAEWVQLPGPVVGAVRTDAIVAVVVR